MKKVTVYLDNKEFSKKPTSYEISMISKRILDHKKELSLKELAIEISTKGKTVVLADYQNPTRLSRSNALLGQQLIMLDFDNKDHNNQLKLKDIENNEFLKKHACFYYKTFSHTLKKDKFRIAFLLDTKITSVTEIEAIYQYLFSMFPECDTSIGQTNRLFFGGRLGYTEINFNNTLNTSEILKSQKGYIMEQDSPVLSLFTPNYLLFKHKAWDLLKQKFGDTYKAEFSSLINIEQYLMQIDIKELLEFPDENPFIDILHNESNPSASVFYSSQHNRYLYKCFSKSAEFQGDILKLLTHYLDLSSKAEILHILRNIMGLELKLDSQLSNQKYLADSFITSLTDGYLEDDYPNLYNYIKQYTGEITATLNLMFQYTYVDSKTGETKLLSYFSIDTLRKLVGNSLNLGKPLPVSRMWTVMNILVVTEMALKLEDKKIPQEIYTKVIEKQLSAEQLRVSTFYEPSAFGEADVKVMDDIAKILKENSITKSSLSYETVYRVLGEDKAKKTFPQAYQPLIDSGKIKMSKTDTNLTKKSVNLEKKAVKIIMEELETKGYVFEEEIIKKISRSMRKPKPTIYSSFTKIRSDIYLKYGLSRKKLTKDLYQELKVDIKYSPKIVIYREE